MMKNNKLFAMSLLIYMGFSSLAMAANISRSEYSKGISQANVEYKSAKLACNHLSGNGFGLCIANAKGKRNVSKADLKFRYNPSRKNQFGASIARADADYAIAMEKCDSKAGNLKDVCVKEAKAVQIHQITDAKVKAQTLEADSDANSTKYNANVDAIETKRNANAAADEENKDADYAVAKEKCDALAGNAKDVCIDTAKSRYAK
jgi:hypothetical protein